MKHIYVITMPGHPYCKIGIAGDLKQRLAALQIGNPYRLEIASTTKVHGDIADLVEIEAHKLLEPHQTIGEWFEVTPEQAQIAVDEALSAILSQPQAAPFKVYFRSLSKEERQQLANAVKTSIPYLSQIASGHRSASPKMALAIERATGGQVTRRALRPDIYEEENAAA